MKRTILILTGILLVIGAAIGLAFLLPARGNVYDFVMIFSASLGIVQRVPLYDNAAIIAATVAKSSVPSGFTVFPYPYPPWYALSTFYLGFLPLKVAANAWMLLNVAMLAACVILLTDGWRPLWRILAVLAGLLFLPALGLLVVGQYSVPVLLGAALFMYSVRHEDAPLTAVGLLLMTFKPHIGLFLLPIGFFRLVFQKTPFARRAIRLALGGALLLCLLGFIADPVWPISYVHSVLSYTTLPGVANRDLSASFPVLLVKLVTGQSSAFWAGWLCLAIAAVIALFFRRFGIFADAGRLVAGVVLMTLLADPYLFNYDYVLLLLPLIYLAGQARQASLRLLLAGVYLLPWLSLLLARAANIFYACAALVLLVILLRLRGTTPVMSSCVVPGSFGG
jgi:hypothetical protein